MKEYKVTKERLEAMAEECPEAKEVLKRGFPEVFEEEWEDISEDVVWMPFTSGQEGFCLWGYDEGKKIAFFDSDGMYLDTFANNSEDYKKEEVGVWYRILKRRVNE